MLADTFFSAPDAPECRVDVADDLCFSSEFLAAWQELARKAAEPNSFMEHWFAVPSLNWLCDGQKIRLLSVWSGVELIGVMPVATKENYGRIPIRHTVNWLSIQSFYNAPLIAAGQECDFWGAVLRTLDLVNWAPAFLSVSGLEEHGPAHIGLMRAAQALHRPRPIVHRYARALLSSTKAPDDYLDEALRGKKRKELRRLSNRLAELGEIEMRAFSADDEIATWMDDFLALEAAGWKGQVGAAFANAPESRAFFKEVVMGAYAAGALEFLRLDLDGRAIAMLINFICLPGSYSFKIAYDENLARFSPGVMIEIENLRRILSGAQSQWMDSCAVADHPMINSLWMERRSIVQMTVPLAGVRRRAVYAMCRALESGSARIRKCQKRNTSAPLR